MSVEQASTALKPKSDLPAREQGSQPNNLIVKIRNVADEKASFKNYVKLYVNGYEIDPSGQTDNMTSIYRYPMHLPEGVYEVRAEYHDVSGWRGKVYKIVPDEPVKVLPDKCTVLDVELAKNDAGGLARSPTYFRLRYEDITSASRAK